MQNKFDNLIKYLNELKEQGLCLAFSGGIDSTLLLYLCRNMNILAITFKSDFQTDDEIKSTKILCEQYNVKQLIIQTDILKNQRICNNPKDRCYHCKKMLFETALNKMQEMGIKYLIDGTNFDDLKVYRPGRKALAELKVISPFAKFEITKQEIRNYAKECGIEIFDKPSTPCLATRFPYNTKLTKEKLKMVENGEQILKNQGFNNCRLRLHNDIARIEIPTEQFNKFIEKKAELISELKSLGLKYLTLDIEGLRSGSMDI